MNQLLLRLRYTCGHHFSVRPDSSYLTFIQSHRGLKSLSFCVQHLTKFLDDPDEIESAVGTCLCDENHNGLVLLV